MNRFRLQTAISRSLVDPTEKIEFQQTAKKMYTLMSKHIGSEAAISRRNVFKHFFGDPDNMNPFQQLYYWGRLLQITHYLRKHTPCFIITEQRQSDIYFFVAKTQKDANIYIKKANEYIKGFESMKLRAQKAIDEKWYKRVTEDAGQHKRKITC